MTARSNLPKLSLPGLRARMGDWIYYICFMKMLDIANQIRIDETIQGDEVEETSMQRPSTNRTQEIATYLLTHRHRFLNALVVGVYGGDPKWNELEIKSTFPDTENSSAYLFGSQGILTLSGDEILFAIDGQNRIAGIRQALKHTSDMADDEIPIILVAGVPQEHMDDDPVGFERTRQLFRALNR